MNTSSELNEYFRVCHIHDLRENEGKRFLVNDVDIALFLVDNEIFALSNVCPHQHSALIYDGFVEDKYIYCPVHGWQFNIEDGRMKNGGKGLDVFPVRIFKNEVYVKVEKKKLNW